MTKPAAVLDWSQVSAFVDQVRVMRANTDPRYLLVDPALATDYYRSLFGMHGTYLDEPTYHAVIVALAAATDYIVAIGAKHSVPFEYVAWARGAVLFYIGEILGLSPVEVPAP